MASNQQTLADAVGAKLREELGKPRTSHGEILADATAYNMAVAANDETTIGHLAEKYGVTGPKPAPKPKNTGPAPKPDPKKTTPKQIDLDAWRAEVDARLDGHDRRHEEAEANLKELNGAVGIVKDSQGTWVPAPDGQFAANTAVQDYLGHKRGNDGQVTFTDPHRPASQDTSPAPRYWILFVGVAVGVLFFFLFFAFGGGAVYALVSLAAGAAIGLAVFLLDLTLRRSSAPTNNHPSR